MLASGPLKRNTCGTPYKFLVSSMTLEEFRNQGTETESENHVRNFTWKILSNNTRTER